MVPSNHVRGRGSVTDRREEVRRGCLDTVPRRQAMPGRLSWWWYVDVSACTEKELAVEVEEEAERMCC